MDELLNLLRVRFCNCSIKDEDIIKLKAYIESGEDSLNLAELVKYDMESALRSHYNVRESFWSLMDTLMGNKEVFKRIINVFFAIGGNSFFKIVNGRFYSPAKTVNYLKVMEDKENLLVWIIKNCFDHRSVIEVITIAEEMILEDKEILTKSFFAAQDDFVKLALAALAIKNSCELPGGGEEFIKQSLGEDGENINKYLKNNQVALVNFFYHACDVNENLKEVISNIIRKSTNRKMLFDNLVSFVCFYDKSAQSYDVANRFNIDKKLYVQRLLNLYVRQENRNINKEIEERIKEIPLAFRETFEALKKKKLGHNNFHDLEVFSLAYFIYSYSKEEEDFDKLKETVRDVFYGFVYNARALENLDKVEKTKIMQYILEGKNEVLLEGFFARVKKYDGHGGYIWHYYGLCFKLLYSLEESRNIIHRFLYLAVNTGEYDLAASVISNVIESQEISFMSLSKKLLIAGINERHLILSADAVLNPKAKEYLRMLCNEGNTELINILEDLKIESKEVVLEALFKTNKEKYSEILVGNLSDNSKVIRDRIAELLSSYEECKKQVLKILASKKTATREIAARILMNFDMREFKAEIEKFAGKEKNEKVKVLLLNIVNADYLETEILESANSISNYCSERLKKTSYTAPEWMAVEGFVDVKYEDGDVLSKDVITYIISKYSLENVVERNLTAEKLIERCNKADLDTLGNVILNLWINNGADTKQKWVLALVSAIGGFNVVNTLKAQIDVWAKSSRGSIACEAVKALALNGSDDALIIIDNIARKFKHKQIKKAAGEAFVSAAKMFNLTEDDLADKIIPDLGFDKRGERVFDFGSRSFTVSLGLDFSLKISDNTGKVIKTMPKPNKSDDELKAKDAANEFKALKKQMKTIVSAQSLRLEMALAVNRLWKKKDWEKLFVENPIMHNFSLGLVWGIYEDGELKDTFRYMEDGSFNTVDEEEYYLIENSLIGLVHPLELETEMLEGWKQQFEDYEIVQPFPQLQRKVYTVTEEEKEMKNIERFAGTKINGLSLVGKLTKMGWYRGSVQDAGAYYQFYKEDEKIGIGAELQFDYLGVYYEDEETTIYELFFYKANTVERGSYVYDEVTDENIISPVKVPKRFFSEILYDVDRTLEAKAGFTANWKMDR
ncbi:DUF4132 domain-containing protein [Clostridium beijerinckii]|uniref:DUF4132 domain-containing protein n=1 Tax=Clostridium beijerinckii TaxID=1520 RepID=UPI00098BDEF9|nr:DUF4132 domain-containing protein [Clostridium beijerinckii]NRU38971.1 hypothetical protein [Clostridium beijerinckii]NSA97750.1 hypothetical protein [Clostridium beijerinckii]OOM64489.1 hypothetical protein CLOBI_16350 [Clostridium beijerinckii]OOM69195.1 hypothetical protein CLBEIC_28880 [Clostridium beijerinckii]CUU48381.1 conserved protein of unknown function [Clostridium beijerinckii]